MRMPSCLVLPSFRYAYTGGTAKLSAYGLGREIGMRRATEWAKMAFATVALSLAPSIAIATSPRPHGGPIEHATLLGVLRLDGQLFHVQGVVLDDTHIWVTSVDKAHRKGYLHEFDRASGKYQRRVELTDGMRYHPGGISISGRSIWVPVAEMKRNSSAVLDEIDADSLQIRRRIRVADHLGCVAASESTLIAGNWDSKLFYVFDLASGAPMRVVPNPSHTHFQDMKLLDGQLVASGSLSHKSGTLDWIDWPSMKITRTLQSGATNRRKFMGRVRPYTGEGMAIDGREIYLVPQDGPSRMFHFRLDS